MAPGPVSITDTGVTIVRITTGITSIIVVTTAVTTSDAAQVDRTSSKRPPISGGRSFEVRRPRSCRLLDRCVESDLGQSFSCFQNLTEIKRKVARGMR